MQDIIPDMPNPKPLIPNCIAERGTRKECRKHRKIAGTLPTFWACEGKGLGLGFRVRGNVGA